MRRSTNTASCFKTRSTNIEMKVYREERLKIKTNRANYENSSLLLMIAECLL